MPRTDLKAGSYAKYGIVRVYNDDGSLNRAFRITREELFAIGANGVPPGVTRQEWTSGRAVVGGRACDVGDAELMADGAVRIKLAERLGSVLVESYLKVPKGQWSGTFPLITVAKGVLDGMDLSRGDVAALQSINNGQVQWQSR